MRSHFFYLANNLKPCLVAAYEESRVDMLQAAYQRVDCKNTHPLRQAARLGKCVSICKRGHHAWQSVRRHICPSARAYQGREGAHTSYPQSVGSAWRGAALIRLVSEQLPTDMVSQDLT